VRQGIRFGLTCTIATIGMIGGAVFLFAPQIIGLFNRNPEVIRFGTGRARVCGLFYCLVGFSHVASAVMRGLGKPVTPMVIMLTCWCAVRILVLFTLGQALHDIRLAFWIYPFTWALSSAVYVVLLKRLRVEQLGSAK
jgi:Na+-driven multidrug efflux pump